MPTLVTRSKRYTAGCRGVVQLWNEVQGNDGDSEALPQLPCSFH